MKPTLTTEAPDFGAMEPFELTLWREGMETYRLTTDTQYRTENYLQLETKLQTAVDYIQVERARLALLEFDIDALATPCKSSNRSLDIIAADKLLQDARQLIHQGLYKQFSNHQGMTDVQK